MNEQTLHLLGIGLLTVLLGSVVIITLVGRELAPDGGLSHRGRWLLTAGLGTGILAFTAKLTLIFLIAALPEWIIPPTPPTQQRVGMEGNTLTPLPSTTLPGTSRYLWQALPEIAPSPVGNPWSPAKAALGQRLFFDKGLSLNGQVACASCHDLHLKAGADGRATAIGIHGQTGSRNAPTVWNAAFQSRLFWDGRASSLEEQAKGPLINPIEMGMPDHAAVERRLRVDPSYRKEFVAAFGPDSQLSIDELAAAIAAYERTLISVDTPYDRFVRGDAQALSAGQLRGMALFESLGCIQCHSGPNFSGASLFAGNSPLRLFPAVATPYSERYRLTEDRGGAESQAEAGLWRIPSLRNVALTAPYFHNGAVDSLEEAVRIMASVQLGRPLSGTSTELHPYWSDREHSLSRVERKPLSPQEVSDLVDFLRALSSERLSRAATAPPAVEAPSRPG